MFDSVLNTPLGSHIVISSTFQRAVLNLLSVFHASGSGVVPRLFIQNSASYQRFQYGRVAVDYNRQLEGIFWWNER